MTTMLERAARAAEVAEREWNPNEGKFYHCLARAVLLAVREPDDPVFEAEAMNLDGPLSRGVISAPEFFTAMIDAILEGDA